MVFCHNISLKVARLIVSISLSWSNQIISTALYFYKQKTRLISIIHDNEFLLVSLPWAFLHPEFLYDTTCIFRHRMIEKQMPRMMRYLFSLCPIIILWEPRVSVMIFITSGVRNFILFEFLHHTYDFVARKSTLLFSCAVCVLIFYQKVFGAKVSSSFIYYNM